MRIERNLPDGVSAVIFCDDDGAQACVSAPGLMELFKNDPEQIRMLLQDGLNRLREATPA